MDRLIEGYRKFRAETWPADRARYEALSSDGQKPHTLVIACSDSRVDPQRVFGVAPGELFVVRNVAGLAPPCQSGDNSYHGTSAALEFGVRVLGVSKIVALGHAQCGGIQAMIDGAPEGARDFVAPWMTIAEPALERARAHDHGGGLQERCEAEVLRLVLDNLMTFPWVKEAVEAGRLSLHAYQFAIYTGQLRRLEGDALVPVD